MQLEPLRAFSDSGSTCVSLPRVESMVGCCWKGGGQGGSDINSFEALDLHSGRESSYKFRLYRHRYWHCDKICGIQS